MKVDYSKKEIYPSDLRSVNNVLKSGWLTHGKFTDEFEKEFLGEIPINPEVGKCGDEGKPIVEANPEHEISKIYLDFARKIKSTYL